MPDLEDAKPPEDTKEPQKPVEGKPPEKPADIMIPKARFDERNRLAQTYERIGTPEQIVEALNALAYYREIERQATVEAAKTKDGEPTDKTAKDLAEANAALYKVEPKLAKAIQAGDFAEAHDRRCRLIATERTREVLEESGIEATRESVLRYGKQLATYFDPEEHPSLHALLFVNPEKAVDKAWKMFRSDMAKGFEKDTKDAAPDTRKLPRAPSPGGGSPPAGKTPPEAATDSRELERRLTAKIKAAVTGG